ncbi:MFS transporter [Alteromonas sp. 5E99-2]|uniref:MFS transporter n=1 Tax=Alteromonas sp. 5E99-2 TaxID=2817683 RepID=UPI001A99934B|nr:MFS transporter [Alteromonas sp. 5E99-2]
MNALEVRTALVLASIYMFRMLGLFMVLPVLAISARDFPDYAPALVGIAIGGYGLMQAILQIPMGTLSDKFGRKPIIVVGLSIFAIGSIVAAQADTLLMLVFGRILQGGGAIASTVMALATDVSREKSRPVVMALIGISIGFSFYLAVLIGPLITVSFGLSGIFWLTAIGAIISIPLLLLLVPTSSKSLASLDVVPKKQGLWALATKTQLWRLNVGVFLLHVSITLLFVPFPLVLSSVGYELDMQWKLYLPILVISVAGLGFIMNIARANKESKAIVLAGACMISAFAALAFGSLTLTSVVVVGALFFTGFNYLEATFPSAVSQLAPPGEKGSAMGLYSSFQFSGAFVGGSTAGLLLEYLSAAWVFSIGIAVTAVIILVCAKMKTNEKVQRLVLEVTNTPLDFASVLAKICNVEGVLDAKWSPNNTALYVNAKKGVDSDVLQRILHEAN